jgi:hypothetical protein
MSRAHTAARARASPPMAAAITHFDMMGNYSNPAGHRALRSFKQAYDLNPHRHMSKNTGTPAATTARGPNTSR